MDEPLRDDVTEAVFEYSFKAGEAMSVLKSSAETNRQ
jgi:hypothetical protein